MFSKKFYLLKKPSDWRRLSIANWKAPNDPTVYGSLEIDFRKALDFLKQLNEKTETKVTVTHLVAKMAALTLKKFSDLNGIIRFQKIYLRKTVDIFLQVAIESSKPNEKPDLSGAKIERCDEKSLLQIASELKSKSKNIRKKEDPHFKSSNRMLCFVPAFFLPFVLRFLTFLIYDLGLSLNFFGVPEDPFGSAMVTSVGMFKVPSGYAPLVPMSRVPLIICVGEVKEKPWVIDGVVTPCPILDLSFTFDHRFMDGLTGARMAHYFEEILENPKKHIVPFY